MWCAEEVDKKILLGCNNHFIHIYSIFNKYQQIKVIDSKKDVYALLVLNDGEMFVDAGFSPNKVQLWQTKSFAMTEFSTTEDSWVALLHEWRGFVVVSLFNGNVIFYEISKATGFTKVRQVKTASSGITGFMAIDKDHCIISQNVDKNDYSPIVEYNAEEDKQHQLDVAKFKVSEITRYLYYDVKKRPIFYFAEHTKEKVSCSWIWPYFTLYSLKVKVSQWYSPKMICNVPTIQDSVFIGDSAGNLHVFIVS